MRLLDARTYKLKTFVGDVPPYAILSHRWEVVEISYEDIRDNPIEDLEKTHPFEKIRHSCERARHDGLDYVWNDTCCIDKTSSAELSEAINSMFRWYQESSVCYAYLNDYRVQDGGSISPHTSLELEEGDDDFCNSEWFTRGWTLQELIAPTTVLFFDQQWVNFGSRNGKLLDRIADRTGVLTQILAGRRCRCYNVSLSTRGMSVCKTPMRDGICPDCQLFDTLPQALACLHASVKFKWASHRRTTRPEDIAYSLMGLFDINMPLLYGEGGKAFMRLQEQIVRQTTDHSILLWQGSGIWLKNEEHMCPGALASSTHEFDIPTGTLNIVPWRESYHPRPMPREWSARSTSHQVFQLTSNTDGVPMDISTAVLTVTLWLCRSNIIGNNNHVLPDRAKPICLGILDCAMADNYIARPAILLQHLDGDVYRRTHHSSLSEVIPSGNQQLLVRRLSGPSFLLRTDKIELQPAERVKIRILRQPSSFLLADQLGLESRHSNNDPVYMTINLPTEGEVDASLLVGVPHIHGWDRARTSIPEPWYLRGSLSTDTPALVVGTHVVTLGLKSQPSNRQVYVIWGLRMRTQSDSRHWFTRSDADSLPWCRLIETGSRFGQHVWTRQSPSTPAKADFWINVLNQATASTGDDGIWITDPQSCPKQCVPGHRSTGWSSDRLLDIFPESDFRMGMSATIKRNHGLGRISYHLHVTFFTQGCGAKYASGTIEDQELLVR